MSEHRVVDDGYAHEVLDRAHMLGEHAHCAFEDHPAIEADQRLRKAWGFLHTKIFQFYQCCGCLNQAPEAMDSWLASLYAGPDEETP